jgi:hypothetical protein
MSYNSKNIIIGNVLNKDEIDEIYGLVFSNNINYLMDVFVQTVYEFDIPYRIAKKIIGYAEDAFEVDNLEIEEYQFARYKKIIDSETGEVKKPNLIPHCDMTFSEQRYTFDYQIGGNTTWPIIVEDNSFTLNNNQALTFSGTHQVHWRELKEFDDVEYIDMVFFHLKERHSKPYGKEVIDDVTRKTEYYGEIYNRKKYA